MLPSEVFVSHSNLYKDFTQHLTVEMARHGMPFWYSQSNILGAQQWHDEIGDALKRCDWFLVILSPNSVQSMWVKRELIFALQQNRFENKIIPLLYQACDYENLSWVLPSFQIVDFQGSFDEGCRNLFRLWGIDYKYSV